MLFPDSGGPLSEANWAYIIHYNQMGYVQDDDANDINYDELLEGMQRDTEAANPGRTEAMHLLGWGTKPYHDQQHTLHWARLLRFGSSLDETLNYSVRILGRKGVLLFNAVAQVRARPASPAYSPTCRLGKASSTATTARASTR